MLDIVTLCITILGHRNLFFSLRTRPTLILPRLEKNKIHWKWIFFFRSSKFQGIVTGFNFYCHFISIKQVVGVGNFVLCENEAY